MLSATVERLMSAPTPNPAVLELKTQKKLLSPVKIQLVFGKRQ